MFENVNKWTHRQTLSRVPSELKSGEYIGFGSSARLSVRCSNIVKGVDYTAVKVVQLFIEFMTPAGAI